MTRIDDKLCDMIIELTKAGVNLVVVAEPVEFRKDYFHFKQLTDQRSPWHSGVDDAEFWAGLEIAGHDISDTLAKDIRKQYKKLKISQICKEPEISDLDPNVNENLLYIPYSAIVN